jgi:hypothetical protein
MYHNTLCDNSTSQPIISVVEQILIVLLPIYSLMKTRVTFKNTKIKATLKSFGMWIVKQVTLCQYITTFYYLTVITFLLFYMVQLFYVKNSVKLHHYNVRYTSDSHLGYSQF